jgi:GNAT superfamily N-acetyltransferase
VHLKEALPMSDDHLIITTPSSASLASGGVEQLAALVNDAYEVAEAGLWVPGVPRTTDSEIASLLDAGELLVASRPGRGFVGVVRLRTLDAETAEFGMLAAAADQRGLGIGRALVREAEDRARSAGCRELQLELLVPRTGTHPSKAVLADWYSRAGYALVRTTTIEEIHPGHEHLLATPCAVEVRRKPLEVKT